jgi:outer membrane protein assembly factor BamB
MRPDATLLVASLVLLTQGACTAASAGPGPSPAAVVAALPEAPAGDGWPSFRGPNRNGISSETGINKNWAAKAPRLLWQKPLSDDGYAGPACAMGMVFIVDHQGQNDIVRAWRLNDGGEVWTYSYPDASSSNYGFSRSTPAVANGMVYVVSRLGKVICLDAKTGRPVWQRDMVGEMGGQKPNWDYAGSPIVDGDRVVVTPGAADAGIAVLNAKTGATILKGSSGVPGYSTPVVATIGGVKQYVAFLGKKICGIDHATGKELWAQPWDTSYDVNAASPLVIGDSVFITSGYGKGCAMVDVKGGQASIRWQNRSMQAHFSSPVFFNGRIYGTGDPGVLVCLNPADGATLWRQQGFEKGGIAGVDGMILAMNGSNGDLILIKMDPSGYQEAGRVAPIRGQAWTAPIVADKKAIIRTKTDIAVIDLS